MVLIDDVILGLGTGVIVAGLVILLAVLGRYRELAGESRRSTELARNIYESMSTRFATQDERIVDLMARVEVFQAKNSEVKSAAPLKPVRSGGTSQGESELVAMSHEVSRIGTAIRPPEKSVSDTELIILRALLNGPRTSNAIRDVINVTREHNGRILKQLYERGLVYRKDENKPFIYEITEQGRGYLSKV